MSASDDAGMPSGEGEAPAREGDVIGEGEVLGDGDGDGEGDGDGDGEGDGEGEGDVLVVPDPSAMEALGRRLAGGLSAGDVVVLTGPLGAGKTALARGIGAGLGVRGPVASPTFVLARTHPSQVGGPPLVHVDAYRLADALALDDLDLDVARSVVVVEWGADVAHVLADAWLEVVIERPQGAGADVDDMASEHVGPGSGGDVEGGDEAAAGGAVEPRRVRLLRRRTSGERS